MTTPWLAGVDGCKGGWVVTLVEAIGDDVRVCVVSQFADIMALPEQPRIIALDIPIGLPARIGADGRGPEHAVRELLGRRKPSVFPVPSRAAVYAKNFSDARRIALATSDPPKSCTKQLFMLASKIREVDTYLRAVPQAASHVYETHPELAFWRLNDSRPLPEPKKVKSRPHSPGLALRRALLAKDGFAARAFAQKPPRGAAEDDLLDAFACAAIARRIHAGTARPFPDPPLRDEYGLPIAIWA